MNKKKGSPEPTSPEEDESVPLPSELPPPPDGGWGWVVVFASFCASFILDGMNYAFSPSLEALTIYFNEPRGKIAWIGSLIPGVYNLTGPLASALSNKFGLRPVCIAGAIVASAAYALTFFATSVEYLIVVQGVMVGFGFGLIFLPAIVVVGYYFEKRRALATGIAVCGSGVGTFVFPPLMYFLIEKYGWRGANLILSGITLNICWIGGLMRPLKVPKMKKKDLLEKLQTEEVNGVPIIKISQPRDDIIKKAKIVPATVYSSYTSLERFGSRDIPKKGSFLQMQSNQEVASLNRRSSIKNDIAIRPMSRQDIFYTGSIKNIREFRREESFASYRQSTTDLAGLGASKIITDALAEGKGSIKDEKSGGSSLSQLLDFTLLKDKIFILIICAYNCAFLALHTPFVFLPAAAMEKGVDQASATFLVSIIGISNTFGRVFSGWVSNIGKLKPMWVNIFSLLAAGIVVFMVPFISSYGGFTFIAISFGFFVAAFPALMSPILADLFGLDKLSNAFGFCILFCGISSMVGAPISGNIYDSTQSFDASFFFAGSLLMVCGSLFCLVLCLKRFT